MEPAKADLDVLHFDRGTAARLTIIGIDFATRHQDRNLVGVLPVNHDRDLSRKG